MRRVLPASLAGRLLVTTVALVAVVSLLVAVTATLVMRSYLTGRLDDQLSQSLDRAAGEVDRNPVGGQDRAPNDGRFCGSLPPLARGQAAGSVTAIFTDGCFSGLVIPSSGVPRRLSRTALVVLQRVEPGASPRTVNLRALGSYRVAAVTRSDGTIVAQALPTDAVTGTVRSMIWWETLLALAGVIAAALVGRGIIGRQLRPLRNVAATAHEVAAMPLSSGVVGETVRVPEDLTDPTTEVGQVGEALNRLLGHVEQALDDRHESEEQLRQFLADASHELRTPLTTIKGYAELSRRTGADDPVLAKVESEANRMSSLVEDMLLLARLDSGRQLDRTAVDLTRLLVEAVDDARVVDPERRWTFDLPGEPVTVSCDEQRLHQVVTNLLTNASRHTPPGAHIEVRMRLDDTVRIDVHDDGPGIDTAMLPTLFDRFTRGDSSRTRASGGAGLGLSLVRAIVHGHGGTATVTSEPGDTTFTITLPHS